MEFCPDFSSGIGIGGFASILAVFIHLMAAAAIGSIVISNLIRQPVNLLQKLYLVLRRHVSLYSPVGRLFAILLAAVLVMQVAERSCVPSAVIAIPLNILVLVALIRLLGAVSLIVDKWLQLALGMSRDVSNSQKNTGGLPSPLSVLLNTKMLPPPSQKARTDAVRKSEPLSLQGTLGRIPVVRKSMEQIDKERQKDAQRRSGTQPYQPVFPVNTAPEKSKTERPKQKMFWSSRDSLKGTSFDPNRKNK